MGRGVVFVGCLAVTLLACLGGAAAMEYVVGDSRGWTAPPNITAGYYDQWAAGKTFRVGDSLKFVWNGTHNVGIVSKEEYDNCTKVRSIVGSTEYSSYVYALTENASGPNYFICTMDSHCKNGQKFSINVVNLTLPEPPSSSASSTTVGALSMLVLLSSNIISNLMN